jgi:hypothetical protein
VKSVNTGARNHTGTSEKRIGVGPIPSESTPRTTTRAENRARGFGEHRKGLPRWYHTQILHVKVQTLIHSPAPVAAL